MSKVRSYAELVEPRVARLAERKLATARTLGRVGALPLFRLDSPGRTAALPAVLLSAGIHGDEPAGVLAALEFLENRAVRFSEKFSFVCFPCLNLSGFEADARHTAANVDLNRSFSHDSSLDEVKMVVEALDAGPKRYACSISLHEDNPRVECDVSKCAEGPGEFYMYESCLLHSMRIGTRVIARLRAAAVPVCGWETIYGDKNTGGVVQYGDLSTNSTYKGLKDFESFLLQSRTNLALVPETPLIWTLERRIEAHLLTIEAVLEELLRAQAESFVGGGL
jgi:hypothetical protein